MAWNRGGRGRVVLSFPVYLRSGMVGKCRGLGMASTEEVRLVQGDKMVWWGMCGVPSPRMGHTLGEIFTHAQSLNFKNRNSWTGRADSVLVDHPCAAASRASPSPISAGCCMQAAAETTASGSTRRQRRPESWSSSSSLQRGWSARMATRYSSHRPAWSIWYRSLHVSSSANDSFKKFTGARSRRPHHSHVSHGWQNRRSSFCRSRTVREEVRIWWQSRGL